MISPETAFAILDGQKEPVVFVDAQHVIRYANKAGLMNYAKWGDIVGRSIFDCHNEQSCDMIREVFAAFERGEEERLISENDKRRVYMTAVRDESGGLLGYCERYERLSGGNT